MIGILIKLLHISYLAIIIIIYTCVRFMKNIYFNINLKKILTYKNYKKIVKILKNKNRNNCPDIFQVALSSVYKYYLKYLKSAKIVSKWG